MGAICCVFSIFITSIQNWKLCCNIDLTYEELWNHRSLQKGSGPMLQMQPSVEHLLNLGGTCAGLLRTWVLELDHPLWSTVHLQLLPCNVKCVLLFFLSFNSQSLAASTPPAFAVLRLSFFTSHRATCPYRSGRYKDHSWKSCPGGLHL